jgi:hypothetical protein
MLYVRGGRSWLQINIICARCASEIACEQMTLK